MEVVPTRALGVGDDAERPLNGEEQGGALTEEEEEECWGRLDLKAEGFGEAAVSEHRPNGFDVWGEKGDPELLSGVLLQEKQRFPSNIEEGFHWK